MPDWSWVQSVLEWMKFVPGWVWAAAWTPVCVIIGFLANNLVAPRWKEIRKIQAQTERMPELKRRLEEIKSDTGILRDDITSVRAQGRGALIGLFDKCSVLSNEYSSGFVNDVTFYKKITVAEYCRSVEQIIVDIRIMCARVLAYFHEDGVLREEALKVMLSSKELRDVIRTHLYPVIRARSMRKRQRSRELVTAQEVTEKERKFLKEIELPAKKFEDAFGDYGVKMSLFFEQIHLKSKNRF